MIKERHGFYDQELTLLKNYLNQPVICLYYDFGKLKGYKGILKDIHNYDYIEIDNKKIKFLGERTSINYIINQNKDILYANTEINNYTGRLGHFMHLIEMQQELLGYSIIEEIHKLVKK